MWYNSAVCLYLPLCLRGPWGKWKKGAYSSMGDANRIALSGQEGPCDGSWIKKFKRVVWWYVWSNKTILHPICWLFLLTLNAGHYCDRSGSSACTCVCFNGLYWQTEMRLFDSLDATWVSFRKMKSDRSVVCCTSCEIVFFHRWILETHLWIFEI